MNKAIHHNEPISLQRDCDAVLIPSGTPIVIPRDSTVMITQALGGSYTVNINGNLARIAPQDADALGYAKDDNELDLNNTVTEDDGVNEELIWQQLRTCYDPEIPINIVELGLIYDCAITPLDSGRNRVDILMTLTAPGCGMGEFLAQDVQSKVAMVPNVSEVNVELTFDPPWDQSMMSDTAKLETGLY